MAYSLNQCYTLGSVDFISENLAKESNIKNKMLRINMFNFQCIIYNRKILETTSVFSDRNLLLKSMADSCQCMAKTTTIL